MNTTPLYAVLGDPDALTERLAELETDIRAGVIDGARLTNRYIDRLELDRGRVRCLITLERAPDDRLALVLRGSLETPEDVALCWDTLVMMMMSGDEDVWLSTYTPRDFEHIGAVDVVEIEGRKGVRMTSEQFGRFVESR